MTVGWGADVGWQFGHYRMEGLIARGGMGEVHRAYDTQHDRVVAVKLLNAHLVDDDEFRRRFIREARAAARLREPHVIPIHAYGEIDGRLYLDMRLVEGDDVSTLLARHGFMAPSAAVDLVVQVAGALDAAHADGLVHRDVKPSNVLLDAGGFAYLVDFGIARSMSASSAITGIGVPVGTVAYMAPERFQPDSLVDHRADVYSLACLLYQCLAGSAPFPDENPFALMQAHLHREPPRLTDRRPDLPPALDHVITTGMAKNPADRYQTAGCLAVAARHALARQASRPATVPVPLAPLPPHRAGRWWLVGAAVAVVAALAGAAVLIGLARSDGDGAPESRSTTTTNETTTRPDPPDAELAVSVPISTPDCDGSYIVIVGSAVNPDEYPQDVQAFLDAKPGAGYLHAPSTGCGSLRQRIDGADIYSVYYGPFPDEAEACARRTTEGGDAFVRRLDNTSSPEKAVSCG
ncbi:serine/threonine-protein kinase [Actinophytocola sp. NPDC049390]|uniref:serine/threonine-protein kinase n=1 Tax=Actinophytocola sp. NPDC049390 TaxID=3363894 RepID=UPI0037A65F43